MPLFCGLFSLCLTKFSSTSFPNSFRKSFQEKNLDFELVVKKLNIKKIQSQGTLDHRLILLGWLIYV